MLQLLNSYHSGFSKDICFLLLKDGIDTVSQSLVQTIIIILIWLLRPGGSNQGDSGPNHHQAQPRPHSRCFWFPSRKHWGSPGPTAHVRAHDPKSASACSSRAGARNACRAAASRWLHGRHGGPHGGDLPDEGGGQGTPAVGPACRDGRATRPQDSQLDPTWG